MAIKGEMPVYLFTGFLESGKTTFLEETLGDPRFNNGQRTLILLCEEGEAEITLDRPYMKNIFVETIDDMDMLILDDLTLNSDEDVKEDPRDRKDRMDRKDHEDDTDDAEDQDESEVIDISSSNRIREERAREREERSAQFRQSAAARRQFKERFMTRGGQQSDQKPVDRLPQREVRSVGRSRPQTKPITRHEIATAKARSRMTEAMRRNEAEAQSRIALRKQQDAAIQARADAYDWNFSYNIRKEPDESQYMFRYREAAHKRRGYDDAQTKILRNTMLASCKYSEE